LDREDGIDKELDMGIGGGENKGPRSGEGRQGPYKGVLMEKEKGGARVGFNRGLI
jgi:hypothetical protein